MRRILVPLLALTIAGSAEAQTVVLVRHGEKGEGDDPDLTAAGQARAQALADKVKGVSRVLATPTKRTIQTASRVAAASGLAVEPVSFDGGGAAHIARVAAEVRKARAGETVLVVGHSNTVPEIAKALGDTAPVPLSDCEYDSLTIIDLDAKPATIVHARYGAPTKAC